MAKENVKHRILIVAKRLAEDLSQRHNTLDHAGIEVTDCTTCRLLKRAHELGMLEEYL